MLWACVIGCVGRKKNTHRLAYGHIFFFFVRASLTTDAKRNKIENFFCQSSHL